MFHDAEFTHDGRFGNASSLITVQLSKSVELAIWIWMLVPFVRVAKAYQTLFTSITQGSGKLAEMTGPVTVRFML